MALEMKIPQKGGVSHSKGYVRITDVRVCRKDDNSTFVMVDMACYASKTKRDAGDRMSSPEIDKRKYDLPADMGGDPFAWAYGQLKADITMTDIGAMTDV
jgi:hypothetical protein|tara:strand:- start:86 stop:385 length:300 start_codon:yes stop_codon:yes gene_type:complete